MTKQLGFFVDTSLCTGCKTCQIACKDKFDLNVGSNFRRVVEYAGGVWIKHGNTQHQNIFAYYVSYACNHCSRAACQKACPVGAIVKRKQDGVVLIDSVKCIGCRACEKACPYGAPQFNGERKNMTKCTFCNDALSKGNSPACVDSCPLRALHFGKLDELRKRFGNLSSVEPLPHPDLTGPSLVIKPHRHAPPAGSNAGRIGNLEEIS